MIIMGLDLATVSSGISVLDDGNLVFSGLVITPDSMKNPFERICFIQEKITELQDKYNPSVVAIEDVPLSASRNLMTAKHLILLAGAIMALDNQRGATTLFLNPSEWRLSAGIFEGKLTKTDMAREAQKARAVKLANEKFGLKLEYISEYSDKKFHGSDLAESILIAVSAGIILKQ